MLTARKSYVFGDLMARSPGSMLFWQTIEDLVTKRIRRKDFAIIVPLGVLHALASAAALDFIRHRFDIPDRSGMVDHSFFADPLRILVTVVAGITLATFVALFQVDESGIPDGLTVPAALAPVGVVAFTTLMGVAGIVETSGSRAYAATVVAVYCLNTLGVSFLMRHFRRKL